MRRVAALLTALAAVSGAAPASAAGLCDPAGHFCVHVDTTSALVCDLLQPGPLDANTCGPDAEALRALVTHGGPMPLRALLVRFDGWEARVTVSRNAPQAELTDAELQGYARTVRERIERVGGLPLDAFAKPAIARIGGVQTVRFDEQWTEGGASREEIDLEVRARDARYVVAFAGPRDARLSALADDALATIDALPAPSPGGTLDALAWLFRALLIAVTLAALMIWLGRRRRGGARSNELWPR